MEGLGWDYSGSGLGQVAGCLKTAEKRPVKCEFPRLYEKMSASHERFCPFGLTVYVEPCNDQGSEPCPICTCYV
jgi:hypothetical protein